MSHLVLGTAGHIDHGKSALVLALTGRDPDRLQEEKRRGITIDLGFADLQLDAEHVLSFVDVPGHERFVRHMVAGATGIDAVLLVVAADQGVQPQTREHLAICRLLGLQRGVVALTKCDLVDDELREVVALELRELLESTFLHDAPFVAVSSKTGQGLEELRSALKRLCDAVPAPTGGGVPRLPVDRSFVMRGFGAVVTGTLVSGAFRAGEDVEVLPSGKRGRIRGLQVHRESVERADAGRRVAVNLQGLDGSDVPRGATLTRPGAMSTTHRVWARVALLDGAPRALHGGGPVRFHQGTCERSARFRVLSVEADGSLRVELYLDQETALAPGDRFILRRPAPVDTVGGGTVFDVRPPRAREAADGAFRTDALELDNAILLRVHRAGMQGCDLGELSSELGVEPAQVGERLGELEGEGTLLRFGPRVFEGELWRRLEGEVIRELRQFHQAEPLRTGLSREELRARVGRRMPQDAWRQLLERMAAAGEVRLEGDKIATSGHEVVLHGPERALAEAIEERFLSAGLEPPEASELASGEQRAAATKIVDLLVARGALVRIHDGKLFHSRALDDLRVKLVEYGKRTRTIDVAAFKALAGVTRKHAIPLLEHLDAQRVTRRVGNVREILAANGPS